MNELRIVSFLPAATEMTCALGLANQLAGVTHECDYPPEVRGKPVVVRSVLRVEKMSLREIDDAVSHCIRSGGSLYEVDEPLLKRLAPTHILTQALCHVCAPSGHEITRALAALPSPPEILWFTPQCLDDVHDNLRQLGRVTGCLSKAEHIIASHRARLERVAALTRRAARRPRVFCLEWTDPYYCAGHWVPEMIEIAGGVDALAHKGADSVRVSWSDIEKWAPEVLLVMPCGFGVERALEQTRQLLRRPGWSRLPAVRHDRVFALDANSYFARPGPRLIDGTELLAHLIHPELCEWKGPGNAFHQIASVDARPRGMCLKSCSAFTLMELLVILAMISVLAALLLPALNQAGSSARRVQCVSNLHQLGLATRMYWDDNDDACFRYRGPSSKNGDLYWFGWLERGPEGQRAFDATVGPLYPYLQGRGVEMCPSLNHSLAQFKLKATGAAYGYGYNLGLSAPLNQPPVTIGKIARPNETVLFADAAQVNTFQPPASPSNPMLEEFYYVSESKPTVHFRHGHKANVLFCDGHVDLEPPVPGSFDPRLPRQCIGRLPVERFRVP